MQETIVLIIFVGALAYLSWRLYVSAQKKSSCGPECGCEPQSKPTK